MTAFDQLDTGKKTESSRDDERLVAMLHELGVTHLVRLEPEPASARLSPDDLLAALARHPRARFRNALILLFLKQPSYSRFVGQAIAQLDTSAAMTLRLYYQAASYLRPELEAELQVYSDDLSPLPDLFSRELGLPEPGNRPVGTALAALGELHQRLSGRAINWAGSYRQYVPLFRRLLKRNAQTAPQV